MRNLFRLVLVVPLVLASGCTGVGYYAQSLDGHLKIMAARQKVDRLAEDESQPDYLRANMALARDIRQFASDALDLPDNASYRSYVDVKRDYVTWAVFAAPEFSLQPLSWCFPIFGCVPYRGYFSEAAAERSAAREAAKGLDVHVAGIIAYSTLGWSADPLVSTMFRQDETYLASLVFHELAHQRVYVKNDSAFNEAFAVAVEVTGVTRWLKTKNELETLQRYNAARVRGRDFLDLVGAARDELDAIYTGDATDEQKREAKAVAIERLRANYRRLRDTKWGGYSGYDDWFGTPINNAKLAATSLYSELVPAFISLFETCGSDYPRFYDAVKRLGALAPDKRVEALKTSDSCR